MIGSADMGEVQSEADWWDRLNLTTRWRLAVDPFGPVPGDLIGEVTNAGRTPIGIWWPNVESGPDGFYLPPDVQQWIADHHGVEPHDWRLVRGDTNIDRWHRGFRFESTVAKDTFGVVYKYEYTGQGSDVTRHLVASWQVILSDNWAWFQVDGEGYGTVGRGGDGRWRVIDVADQSLDLGGQTGEPRAIEAAVAFVQRAVQGVGSTP